MAGAYAINRLFIIKFKQALKSQALHQNLLDSLIKIMIKSTNLGLHQI